MGPFRYAPRVPVPPSDLHLQILENALDFIDRAIVEVRTRLGHGEDENKFAALCLGSGIELLVKARLAMEHWSLIFDDPAVAMPRIAVTSSSSFRISSDESHHYLASADSASPWTYSHALPAGRRAASLQRTAVSTSSSVGS